MKKPSQSPFVLIPDQLPIDVIEVTARLHEQAKKGELIGLAFTGMLRQRGYVANAAGEAHRNPTFAIGMCYGLIWKLAKRLDGGNI